MNSMETGESCVIYAAEELLPAEWRPFSQEGPVRTFNPGLLRADDGWILAYRVVGSDGLRRIGVCRLTAELRIVPGSQIAWSDYVQFPNSERYPEIVRKWFADPRLYRLGRRLFLYWNSGWHEPQNEQFLHEIDSTTLRPIGGPRALRLSGPRQKLEKNWTFFGHGPEVFQAVYSVVPHRVLKFSTSGEDDIFFDEVASTAWTFEHYPRSHGGLRGGAPPVFADGRYWSFCHSVHDGANGYRYAPAVYSFSSEPPFVPLSAPRVPLELATDYRSKREFPRLNPAVDEVIYPCGAAQEGTRWIISHGINDERCAVSIVSAASVSATLEPAHVDAVGRS